MIDSTELCLPSLQQATRDTSRATTRQTDEITELMRASLKQDRWQPLDLASGNYTARTIKNKWQYQS
jgi:hypothetical protein